MKKLIFVALVIGSLQITSCTAAIKNPVPLSELAKISYSSQGDYRIQPGDLLDVKFFYNPELNDQVIVRPDGKISLQLANEMPAAGLTTAELTDLLGKKYSKDIGAAEITIIVRTFSSLRIYVDGEVSKPGVVSLISPMTVLQAVSQAGGFKDTARRNEVVLIRFSSQNKIISTMLDIDKALDGSDMSQDAELMKYDIIYVPKSHITNVNIWVDQYIRRNLPVTPGIGVNF